uniref:Uncharacterized protein n=1 Tax=Strigamia maritima TaxID=126957 RepID=T1J8D9_STRMM
MRRESGNFGNGIVTFFSSFELIRIYGALKACKLVFCPTLVCALPRHHPCLDDGTSFVFEILPLWSVAPPGIHTLSRFSSPSWSRGRAQLMPTASAIDQECAPMAHALLCILSTSISMHVMNSLNESND